MYHTMDINDVLVSELVPLELVPPMLVRMVERRFHLRTVRRWAIHGRYGIRLRTVKLGRAYCTTDAWLIEFFVQSGPIMPDDVREELRLMRAEEQVS